MKYCGTMANIWIEFSIKGEREKEQKYQIIIQDIDFTNFFFFENHYTLPLVNTKSIRSGSASESLSLSTKV